MTGQCCSVLHHRKILRLLAALFLGLITVSTPGRPLHDALADDEHIDVSNGKPPPLVGAIRWGGWFSGSEWAENLDDPQWQSRLPFYASVDTHASDVEILGDRQDVMLREIEYARRAGLSFWAFCYYDERSTEFDKYNYGLKRYLAAPQDAPPGFALILQGSHVGDPSTWSEFADQLISHFEDPRYTRVGQDRPLVFIYDIASFITTFPSPEEARSALGLLESRTVEHGIGAPFFVAQNATADAPELGFDAFSAYTAHGFEGQRELPFASLAQANQSFWEREHTLGRAVVPLLNLGWDPRPRMDDPLWQSSYGGKQSWYAPPTADEITQHVRRGIDWVNTYATREEERVMLLYAWNEFDEGGVVIPTLSEGTARIEAIRLALEPS